MNAYIRRYLKSLLAGWVDQEFSEDSIKIGLLSGQLTLSNLELAHKESISIADGIEASLDKGSIGKLEVCSPWYMLHKGQLSISASDLNLLVHVKLVDKCSDAFEGQSFSSEVKMAKLLEGELRALDANFPSSVTKSWLSNVAQQLIHSVCLNFASAFSLVLNKLHVTVLVPLADDQCVAVELNIDSLVVSRPNEAAVFGNDAWSSIFSSVRRPTLQKSLTIRNITVHLDTVAKPVSQRDIMVLWERPQCSAPQVAALYGLALSVELFRGNWAASALHIFSTVALAFTCCDFDVSFALHQLLLIKHCMEYIIMERRRMRLQKIRKLILSPAESECGASPAVFNARKHWDYVIKAVLFVVKEERTVTKGRHLRSMIANLALRRKYMGLHRKKLTALIEYSDIIGNPFTDATGDFDAQLAHLENILSLDDLIAFRHSVDQEFVTRGVPVKTLKELLSNSPLSSAWSASSMQLSASSSVKLPAEEDKVNFQLSASVARVGLVVFQSSDALLATQGSKDSPIRRVCSLVTYGVGGAWDSSAKLLEGFVGAVDVYGVDSSALLSFGRLNDMNSIAALRSHYFQGNPDLAVSFSVQFMGKSSAKGTADQNEDVGRFQSYDSFAATDVRGNINHYLVSHTTEHLVVESKFSNLTIFWSSHCVTSILECAKLLSSTDSLSAGQQFASEKRRLANMSKHAGSTDVIRESVKVSFSTVFRSVRFVFPLERDFAPVSPEDAVGSALEIGFDNLQLVAGDYLDTLLVEKDKLRVDDESALERNQSSSDALSKLLHTIETVRNPLVHPVVFMLRGVFARYVRSSDLNVHRHLSEVATTGSILRVPWLVDGAVSTCSLDSHRDFTDSRWDLHLGPLELQVETKDIIHAFEVSSSILSMFAVDAPSTSMPGKYLTAPKLRRLDGLSVSMIAMHLDGIKITGLEKGGPTRTLPYLLALEQAIEKSTEYLDYSLVCDVFVEQAYQQLVANQLRNFGFPDSQVFVIAEHCVDFMRSPLSSEETLSSRILQNLRLYIEGGDFNSASMNWLAEYPRIQFEIELSDMDVAYHGFMYNSELSVKFQRVTFFDADHISLLTIRQPYGDAAKTRFPTSNRGLKGKHKASDRRPSTMMKATQDVQDSQDALSAAALDFTYSSRQVDEGVSVEEMYTSHYTTHRQEWRSAMRVESADLDIYLNTTRLFAVSNYMIDLACDIMIGLQERQRQRQRAAPASPSEGSSSQKCERPMSQSIPSASVVTTDSLVVDMSSITLLIACDNRFFSSVQLQGCQVNHAAGFAAPVNLTTIIRDLRLIDLTPAGWRYREVIWRRGNDGRGELRARPSPFVAAPMVTIEVYKEHNTLRIVPRVEGMRLAFLYRFLMEFVVVIADNVIAPITLLAARAADVTTRQPESLAQATEAAAKQSVSCADNSTKGDPAQTLEVEVLCCLIDVQGLVPRNSFSDDIIGLVINSATVHMSSCYSSWPVPTKDVVARTMVHRTPWERALYFNPQTNAWQESECGNGCDDSVIGNTPYVGEEDDDFFDACEEITDESGSGDKRPKAVTRIAIEAEDIGIFLSLAPMAGTSVDGALNVEGEHLGQQHVSRYAEIADNKEVFSRPSTSGVQTWLLVSRSLLNLQVIVDLTATQLRLLFGDTRRPSTLDVAVSQAELYLLLGLWFDNIHELPRFPADAPSISALDEDLPAPPSFPFSEYGGEDFLAFYLQLNPTFEIALVRSEVGLGCCMDTNYFTKQNPNNMYLDYVSDFDRSALPVTNERFRNYLFHKPLDPSFHREARRYSTKLSGGSSHRKVAPIADLHVVGLVLYACADSDTLQLSVSASLFEAYDCRVPACTSVPLILRLAPLDDPTSSSHLTWDGRVRPGKTGKYSYGHAEPEYGFNCTAEDTDGDLDLPLKFSMLMATSSNWMTMNLGLDLADLSLPCIDVFMLLSDFFSSYFRFTDFGHPGLAAYDRVSPALIPYGGIDFRLFLLRPHLALIDATVAHSPPGLFIEAERGAFFRYMLDTDASVKMELNVHDLALVLVKQHRPPSVSRGVRGSSGSGRGVRTMIEYLNAAFTYKFEAKENQLDIECEVYIPDDDDDDEAEAAEDKNRGGAKPYVDMNGGFGGIDPVRIAEPTCLLPLASSNKEFTPYSSNVVTSCEDVLFCKRALDQLLAWDKMIDEPSRHAGAPSTTPAFSKYFVFSLNGVRVLLVDNVLGLHLPLFQGFCESVRCVLDTDIRAQPHMHVDEPILHNESQIALDFGHKASFIVSPEAPSRSRLSHTHSWNHDERAFGTTIFWLDYFNSLKKCWEPFVEKLNVSAQYEKSRTRGMGFIARSSSALQVSASGALIRTLCDTMRTFKSFDTTSPPHISALSSTIQNRIESTMPDWFDELTLERRRNSLDSRLVSFNLHKDSASQKGPLGLKGGRRRSSIIVGNSNLLSNSALDKIDHIPSISLQPSLRVGFSILNVTGQPIRYLQQWEGGKRTVQYLNNNERGLLNIVAAQTLIRNGKIVEETFEVQQEQLATVRARSHRRVVGNRVALQVSGYRWLHSVQADELGEQYEELFPTLGRVDATQVYKDERISYSLKLMVEVLPYCGGRMLRLRSVFTVKNFTKHKLHILAKRGSREFSSNDDSSLGIDADAAESPFHLDADEEWFIPIALLYQSIVESQGRSLGVLFIKPAELKPIEEELESKMGIAPGFVDYSTDPINLFQLASKGGGVDRNEGSFVDSAKEVDYDRSGAATKAMQLCCHISPKQKVRHGRRFGSKATSPTSPLASPEAESDPTASGGQGFTSSKLPPFCYSVEIIRDIPSNRSKDGLPLSASDLLLANPRSFTIAIHPPILIENLLPSHAVFELLHADQKRVLWSSCMAPGAVKAVHSVTLEEPLVLVINLRYCRASEGVTIHRPQVEGSSQRGLVNKLQRAIEGILDEGEQDDVASIILTDTVGQRLRLNVENTQGAGGQRHVVVYCPYWIVNTSQYAFRLREEGEMELTAGSVTLQKDGTRPVPLSNSSFVDKAPVHEIFDPNRFGNASRASDFGAYSPSKFVRSRYASTAGDVEDNKTPVFPGCCGPLHSLVHKEVDLLSPVCDLFRELDMSDVMRMAYMFNYRDGSNVLGSKKVKLQLDDTDWSRPFSLESVGVSQVISIDHPIRGLLEVGLKISVASGRLSKYTKIVRFQPRLAVVNRLNRPLKVMQASGLTGEVSEVEVSANHIKTYHLPALYGERAVSLQVDGPWQRTVFFNVNQIGAFTVEAKRRIDLATTPHVNTRGAPEYTEFLPACKVIGIAFETDWGEENIVVRSIMPGTFAARETDIRVGDVLLAINDELVDGSQFEFAMATLKSRISGDGCGIKLRTVEEKLRLIRESAFQTAQRASTERRRSQSMYQPRSSMSPMPTRDADALAIEQFATMRPEIEDHRDMLPLRIELRLIESTVMLLVNELSDQYSTDYRIENRSVCYRIHYKQKGIAGGSWSTLNPGQSCNFCWPDPFKPHKLLVHVGDNVLCPSDSRNSTTLSEGGEIGERGRGDDSLGKYLGYLAGVSNESATLISLDEIGSKEFLPLHRADAKLLATIKSDGPTKVMFVSPTLERHDLLNEMRYCTSFLRDQVGLYSNVEAKISLLLETVTNSSERRRVGSLLVPIDDMLRNLLKDLNDSQLKAIQAVSAHRLAHGDHAAGFLIEPSLTSSKPVERVLDGCIDCPHQLFVEILEAAELPPLVKGKTEDTYCKLCIRNSMDGVMEKSKAVAFYTYVCDQTLDPKWLNQKFVFDIDPRAEADYRSYSLRLYVKAKSVTGIDNVLAKLDVPFSCLREAETVEGWFPLRPSRSSMLVLNATGSIKLRLHWVHSEVGFASFIAQQIDRRLKELKLQFDVQKHFRRTVEKHAANQAASHTSIFDSDPTHVENDYYAMVEKVSQLHPQQPRQRGRSGSSVVSRKPSMLPFEGGDPERGRLDISDDLTNRLGLDSGEEQKRAELSPSLEPKQEGVKHTPFLATPLRGLELGAWSFAKPPATARHYTDNNMARWIRATRPLRALHSQLSVVMARPPRNNSQNDSFRTQFDREGLRSYAHAFTQSGVLEIAPIQALHLPAGNNYVFVKISYGHERFSTFSVPPAAFTTWHQGSSAEAGSDEASAATGSIDGAEVIPTSLSKAFEVDLLNIKGDVHVRIMSEGFPKSRELARVELPIFGIVDCTCTLDGDGYYDRWFPLTVADHVASKDDEQHTAQPQACQGEEPSYAKFGYHPCIRLRMKWIPTHDLRRVEDPEFYARVQVPSISVSVVDSEHARAVMLASVTNMEARQAVTKVFTDFGLNVTSIQVDNQLPDPIANVILFPKLVNMPQPVLRLHFRKKNLLSQRNLECYQTIQLVVQELDLRLEQQTVLASWALMKNWLHESRIGSEDNQQNRDVLSSKSRSPPLHLSPSSAGSAGGGGETFLPTIRTRRSSIPDNDVVTLLHDDDVVKLYIEDFRIFPIKINVTFLITPPHIIQVYRRELKRLDLQAAESSSSSVSLFLWQVGEVVLDLTSSISDAPIFFNGFEAPHLFKTSVDVTRILQEHYLHSALGQLYKIVGSLDVVGNPIALLSSLSVGVRDFFYEPAHALITSPTAFGKIGKGVMKGTVSLVSNTTAGFLGTGTTITRSIGRGVAKLSMDSSYIKAREKLQKPPGTIKGTLLRPAKDVAVGLMYSVTGLVKVPYSSIKAHGVHGLLPGMAKGVAGLVVDPAVGILDAVTHSGDACKEILKNINKGKVEEAKRTRLGDLFGPDGRLLPYNVQIALGTQILRVFGRYSEELPRDARRGSLLSAAREVWRGGKDMISVDRPQRSAPPPASRRDSISGDEPALLLPKRNSMVVHKNRFSFRALDSESLGVDSYGDGDRRSANESPADAIGADQDQGDVTKEFVIHTGVLQQSRVLDVVVIVSTVRVIVASYARSKHGPFVSKTWERALRDLAPPTLERGGGSSSATLVLRELDVGFAGQAADNAHRKRMGFGNTGLRAKGGDSAFNLVSSYQEEDVLINVFNSLNAALGNFVPLIPPYSAANDACVEDEFGVRHIGPWQFTAKRNRDRGRRGMPGGEEDDQEMVEQKRKLIRELEMERWVHPSEATQPQAYWLRAEERSALDCHARVRELYQRCKALEREIQANPLGKQYLRIPIASLFKGNINIAEFERAVEQSPGLLDDADELSRDSRDKNSETKTSWREYLRFGHSPSRMEQRFFSLFSEPNAEGKEGGSEKERPGPAGAGPAEVPPRNPLSLSGVFPSEQSPPRTVMDLIVQKLPFAFAPPPTPPPADSPEPAQEQSAAGEKAAAVGAAAEELAAEELTAEELGWAAVLEDEGRGSRHGCDAEVEFTYSDLKSRRHRRRGSQIAPDRSPLAGTVTGDWPAVDSPAPAVEQPAPPSSPSEDAETDVRGENPLFELRARANSVHPMEAPPGKTRDPRRWSSPAVLPRLVTPPRVHAPISSPAFISPRPAPPSTASQQSLFSLPPAMTPMASPMSVESVQINNRLDRLEGLLVHLVGHFPTSLPNSPLANRSDAAPAEAAEADVDTSEVEAKADAAEAHAVVETEAEADTERVEAVVANLEGARVVSPVADEGDATLYSGEPSCN